MGGKRSRSAAFGHKPIHPVLPADTPYDVLDMEVVITKEDELMCSVLSPRPLSTGQLPPHREAAKAKAKAKAARTSAKASRPAPSTAALDKVTAKTTALKKDVFFAWLSDLKDSEARPPLYRVREGNVSVRADPVSGEEDVYEVGRKRGVVPYLEEYKVIILSAEETAEEGQFKVTFPSEEELQTARNKRDLEVLKASAEEEHRSDTKALNSTIFGSLGVEAAAAAAAKSSPPKKRYVNEMLSASASKGRKSKGKEAEEAPEEEAKDPAAIAKANKAKLQAALGDEDKTPAKEGPEEEAEAFVDAVFSKAIRQQTRGSVLERIQTMTSKKIEELEAEIGGAELRKTCLLYGAHTAREAKDEKRRRCASCQAKAKDTTVLCFSEPALLPNRTAAPPPDFVVHFVCSKACLPKVQSLLDLLQFSDNCFNRVKRRWALAVAEEAEEPAAQRKDKDSLFEAVSGDGKLRAGLHKSYLELVKRCAPKA